jgi:hypothetical protein
MGIPQPGQADRLQRALPARLPVGRARPPRPSAQERAPLPALGAGRSRPPRCPAGTLSPPLRAHPRPSRPRTRHEGRRSHRRPQALRGDLAHAYPQRALPALASAGALCFWPPDGPRVKCAAGASSHSTCSPPRCNREMSGAQPPHSKGHDPRPPRLDRNAPLQRETQTTLWQSDETHREGSCLIGPRDNEDDRAC